MAANASLRLSPLTVIASKRETVEAVRRLRGAHDSVQGLFDTLHEIRDVKVKDKVSIARLSHSEVDLLRAVLVFAGAGLDAVLKQLIRDALPALLVTSDRAQGALKVYSAGLVTNEPKKATGILVDSDPTSKLKERYLEQLTKGSLQAEGELVEARDALGLPDSGELSTAVLSGFGPFFVARNEVVHELDLKRPTGRGTFTRRYRRMDETRQQADDAIRLSEAFVAAVDSVV